jgi:hypothetical protein
VEPFSASAAERLRDAAGRIAYIDNECSSGFCEPPTTPPATGGDATCDGETATIVGTSRDDRIAGTEGRDVISALAGDDLVTGLSEMTLSVVMRVMTTYWEAQVFLTRYLAALEMITWKEATVMTKCLAMLVVTP